MFREAEAAAPIAQTGPDGKKITCLPEELVDGLCPPPKEGELAPAQ
ncbi:MAG: hypothetical protein ACYC0C_12470 [Devosia sp.]